MSNLNTTRKAFTKEDFRKRAWEDHPFFCKQLFPTAFFVPFAQAHAEIFDLIFSDAPFVGIIAPRKLGKTPTICFSYPLKSILYNTQTYIVIISETMDESRRHVMKITTALETNELIHYYYGHLVNRNQYETQKESAQFSNKVWLRAKSFMSQIRGTGGDWSPPSLIIADDIQSNKDTKSENTLQEAWNWFQDEVIFSRAQKWQHPHFGYTGTGQIRFLGTSLHPLCVAEKVYADSRFKCLRYAILQDAEGNPDIVNGRSIWEDMFPTAELYAEMRAAEHNGTLNNWLQERMNMPYKYGDRAFDVTDMRFWNVGTNRFAIYQDEPVFLMEDEIGISLAALEAGGIT